MTTKKTKEAKAIINTNKAIITNIIKNEDETITKEWGLGKSKYAKATEEDTLKETQFNVNTLVKVVPNKYDIIVNSKGFCLYEGKLRALDIKVQKGNVKIFNHCTLKALESLKEYARIEEDLPPYKAKLFTNCVYVDNKDAIKALRTIMKNS